MTCPYCRSDQIREWEEVYQDRVIKIENGREIKEEVPVFRCLECRRVIVGE